MCERCLKIAAEMEETVPGSVQQIKDIAKQLEQFMSKHYECDEVKYITCENENGKISPEDIRVVTMAMFFGSTIGYFLKDATFNPATIINIFMQFAKDGQSIWFTDNNTKKGALH